MRWTVPLALTTVVFASTTVYLAHALKVARDRRITTPAMHSQLTAPLSQAPTVRVEEPVRKSEPLPDPRRKAEELELKTSLARRDLAGVAKRLGLTRDELDALAAVVARQGGAADRSELVRLLGEEKADAYLRYERSFKERLQVRQFRDHLSKGDDLSDEQMDRLETALFEEKTQLAEAVRLRGEEVIDLEQLQGSAKRGAPDRQARVLETATAFSQRLRARAASILTPTQMAAYEEMLDAELHRQRLQQPD